MITDLKRKITDRDFKVGIIGLGYVGLPLLWTFHKKNFEVIGFDIDQTKIDCLREGQSYIKHLGHDMMDILSKSSKCSATADFKILADADAILMCVPTPLNIYREPDMSFVENTALIVGENLRKGQLVILESTTYPGTTDELIIPILEKKSGLKVDVDFYVAYSPEREDPGNKNFNTASIPKVIGGHNNEALELAEALYSSVIVKTVKVSNNKTAEAVKLTENIFRSVNIALVNELKIVYHAMGIDVNEVLDAAATKPFGFMKFTPGPGLGGHCIPIDPFYLTWKAREVGAATKFIELSGEINSRMPRFVMDQTINALNENKKAINASRILLVGLAYKADIDDMRESPTFLIMELFEKMHAIVDYYDPYIPIILPTREHSKYNGKKSVLFSKDIINSYDAVVIVTDHKNIDYQILKEWASLIVDSRNVYKILSGNIFKA